MYGVVALVLASIWYLVAKKKGLVLISPSTGGSASGASGLLAPDDYRDKLDETNIEQLHQAVVQFGANCFELKKLCVTVVFAAATLLSTFTNKHLDVAFFVASLITVAAFWLLDAQSYYYQDKLRSRMKKLAERIAVRRHLPDYVDGVGMPLSETRENRTTARRVAVALFNWSMSFYGALGVIVLILLILYILGFIHNTSFAQTTGTANG